MLFNSRAAELQDLYIKVINAMQTNIFSQQFKNKYISFIYVMQFAIFTVFHEQIYYIYFINKFITLFSKEKNATQG